MECEEVKRRLKDFLLDSLEKEEGIQLRQHLDKCLDCREEFKQLKQTIDILSFAPELEPEENFNALIWARIKHSQHIFQRIFGAIPAPVRLFWKPALAIAILLLAVISGIRFFTAPPIERIEGVAKVDGNIIVTEDKQAKVFLKDNTTLFMEQETSLKVSGRMKQEVYLEEGEVLANVSKQGVKKFMLKTKAGSITALGTEFKVSLEFENEEGEKARKKELLTGIVTALMTVSVLEGKVLVENEFGQLNVREGEIVLAQAGEAPTHREQGLAQATSASTPEEQGIELMFGFEDESELQNFEASTPPLQLSTEHATQGKHSVKLSGPNLGRKNLLKVYLGKTNFADISGYEYLALDIYNATDAHVFVTIKIEDKNHKDWEIEERGIAPKMKETLEFPISTMKSKGIDPAYMHKIDMWVTIAPSNFSLYVDNMRLGKKPGIN